MEREKTVFLREGDPYIYLWAIGQWYCYNPNEAPIGSGAMGTVYKGYRCKDARPIAVKRVKDRYANVEQIRKRARQEASLAFRHNNLVEMIGCCEWEPTSGPIFLLSNWVEGENIDVFVRRLSRDDPNRINKISAAIMQVLDALDYVHSRGVVHRDIKPSNIMVEGDGNVRLMDLGIARLNGGNQYSLAGFIGTPQYSAPEQILRDKTDSIPINASTDLYALGITFYELLTGVNPFDSDREAEILMKQMTLQLPNDKAIPSRLMQVLLKATEKKQSDRYATAREFKDALNLALQPQPSLFERLMKWLGLG